MNLRQRIRHSQTRPIKDQALEARRFSERAAVAFAIVAVVLLLLATRYFYLQVLSQEEFATRSTNNRVRVVPVPAAVWLFGSGVLGLIGLSRRKKALQP